MAKHQYGERHDLLGPGNMKIPLVILYGNTTAYQKGLAHGTLMAKEVRQFMNTTWSYIERRAMDEIEKWAPNLFDEKTLKLIVDYGLAIAFDLTSNWTQPYTGQYFFDEMRGLAEGSGADYDTIRRIHMIGELTKGACSMFGAWGKALPPLPANQTHDPRILTMRALDWAVDGPFKNFPQITVYHPSSPTSGENSFINFGWTGWIGSITGVNDQRMSIHEIGASYADDTFGNESRQGVPFTHVLRDILQFDKTPLDGVNRLASANRTCNLILGVGGAGDPTPYNPDGSPARKPRFYGIQYSHDVCRAFDDTNMMPHTPWHPRVEGLVYYGMDWDCVSYNQVMHDQLKKHHGELTPEVAIRDVMSVVKTGDLQIVVNDLSPDVMKTYYSVARPDGESGPMMAYDRPFIEIDLKKLLQPIWYRG